MASDLMSDKDSCIDPILKNEVVVMEDSTETSNEIDNVLSGELNWQIIKCSNQDEVVEIARKGQAAFFILDNWVGSKHEGLDALERIKAINQKTFVTIFSGHQIDRSLAERLSGDLFEDKTDISENIRHIAYEMLAFRKKLVGSMLESIESQMKYIESLEGSYINSTATMPKSSHTGSGESITGNLQKMNRAAYKKLLLDNVWYLENKGKYAVFVNGEFEFSEDNRDTCLSKLISCPEYKGKQVFHAKVQRRVRLIEEPSSLSVELV